MVNDPSSVLSHLGSFLINMLGGGYRPDKTN